MISWHRLVCAFSLAALLAGSLAGPASAVPQAGTPPISVLVDGKPLTLDVAPVIVDGRTLVPLRAIFTALGALVEWDGVERSIIARKGPLTLRLWIGRLLAELSSEGVSTTKVLSLDVPPQIVGDRTLVPARFVSEVLGCAVTWDGATRSVKIVSGAAPGMAVIMPDLSILQGAFITHRKPESRELAADKRIGTVLVLVNNETYDGVKDSISTYTTDLADEGYASEVYTVANGDGVDLKAFVRDWWLALLDAAMAKKLNWNAMHYGTGVAAVGDVPVPLVHQRIARDENGKPYEGTYVCDLYLTDMDGNWDYLDDKGVPFISTTDPAIIPPDSECTAEDADDPKWVPGLDEGTRGARPEIWLGHISPGPLSLGTDGKVDHIKEAELIREYFERNHAYRHGRFPYVPEGRKGEDVAARNRLLYYDNDWRSRAPDLIKSIAGVWPGSIFKDNDSMSILYPHNRYINGEWMTKPPDYIFRLQAGRYLWVESLMHSCPTCHEFGYHAWNDSKQDWDWHSEGAITSVDYGIKALFYYLQGCDTCDYRQPNCIGTQYLFLGDSLGVIGNATVGPHDTGVFYKMLAGGLNLGQAYMMNQRAYQQTADWASNWARPPYTGCQPKRYYAQVLLGDPTLRPRVFVPSKEPVSIHDRPDVPMVVRPLPEGVRLPDDPGALRQRAGTRAAAETRDRLRVVGAMPPGGRDFLDHEPGEPVRDPRWELYVDPGLRSQIPVDTKAYTLTLRPEQATVSEGEPVALSGLLSAVAADGAAGAGGIPAPDKPVRIYEVRQAAATGAGSRTLRATVVTNADGVFTYEFTPEGSSSYIASYFDRDQEKATSNYSVITVVPAGAEFDVTLKPATETIASGQSVTFTGNLTSVSHVSDVLSISSPVSGKNIKVFELTQSAAATGASAVQRQLVGTAVTGSDGGYSCQHKPAKTGRYVAVYAEGGVDLATSEESIINVAAQTVSYTLTLEPRVGTITQGHVITLSGALSVRSQIADVLSVLAPVPGKSVRIHKAVYVVTRTGTVRQLTLVAAVQTNAEGKYVFEFSPVESATYVATYEGPDGAELARSNDSVVTVTQPRHSDSTSPAGGATRP